MRRLLWKVGWVMLCLALASSAQSQSAQSDPSADYKAQVVKAVEAGSKETQVMIDMVFSFGELGFQEFETSKYVTGILEKEGFKIERGIAGIPTAWMATWGSGGPCWLMVPESICEKKIRRASLHSVSMGPKSPIDMDRLGNAQNARYYTAEMTFSRTANRRTGISVPFIDKMPHDAVVARPLKRGVRRLSGF